jgi:putative ABC transport system permease protein
MTLTNTIRTALQGIGGNKLRAALTTLGVVIGVASVIAMLALGNGARLDVERSFRFLGADQIQIGMEQELDDGEFVPAGQLLSYEDGLEMPENLSLVERVEMTVTGYGKARNGHNILDVEIGGVMADSLLSLAQQAQVQPVNWNEDDTLTTEALIRNGRFFSPAEVLAGAEVCVLGHETALDLFAGDDPVGQSIWVNRRRCLVIGVLTELKTVYAAERFSGDPNERFYMPISTAINQLFEEEPSVVITAYVTDESQMYEAMGQINGYLRQRHNLAPDAEGNYDNDFFLTTRQDVLGARLDAARTFSLLLAAMAAVSLVVGGIGIMNVMLVSVSERTREIGIRMAIGARRRDLISHFLLEAMIISALGGLLGVAVGILAIPLAANLNEGLAVLQPNSIPVAFSVALATGIIFGLYPAIRASRLNPIEALRYE